jgi:hypothetical protein
VAAAAQVLVSNPPVVEHTGIPPDDSDGTSTPPAGVNERAVVVNVYPPCAVEGMKSICPSAFWSREILQFLSVLLMRRDDKTKALSKEAFVAISKRPCGEVLPIPTLLEKFGVPLTVQLVFNSGMVAPEVPVFTKAAVPKAPPAAVVKAESVVMVALLVAVMFVALPDNVAVMVPAEKLLLLSR